MAPDFAFETVPGMQDSLSAERGRTAVLLILYSVPESLPRLDQLKLARARIDRQGYLRARWIPREFPGWNALSVLLGELDRLGHEPPHPPAPATSLHNH